jgi:hypothetical protein
LSDWFTPQSFAGESKAVIMGHRDSSDGTTDNRTFYLYGYSFALNSAKTIQSIRLPSNANVIVTAISLIPNWPPTFGLNPFTLAAANAGQTYSGTISTNASDLNGGTLTFGKVSGPAWLLVAASGTLSGEPFSADVGNDSFIVSVTDQGNLSNTATMNIQVLPAPPILATLIANTTNLLLGWTGGIPPYQVQISSNLTSAWINLGGTTNATNLVVTPTNAAAFYRLIGK